MPTARALICAAVLLALGGCSGGSDAANEGPFKSAQLAATVQTPAFRNLGKRGDSKL